MNTSLTLASETGTLHDVLTFDNDAAVADSRVVQAGGEVVKAGAGAAGAFVGNVLAPFAPTATVVVLGGVAYMKRDKIGNWVKVEIQKAVGQGAKAIRQGGEAVLEAMPNAETVIDGAAEFAGDATSMAMRGTGRVIGAVAREGASAARDGIVFVATEASDRVSATLDTVAQRMGDVFQTWTEPETTTVLTAEEFATQALSYQPKSEPYVEAMREGADPFEILDKWWAAETEGLSNAAFRNANILRDITAASQGLPRTTQAATSEGIEARLAAGRAKGVNFYNPEEGMSVDVAGTPLGDDSGETLGLPLEDDGAGVGLGNEPLDPRADLNPWGVDNDGVGANPFDGPTNPFDVDPIELPPAARDLTTNPFDDDLGFVPALDAAVAEANALSRGAQLLRGARVAGKAVAAVAIPVQTGATVYSLARDVQGLDAHRMSDYEFEKRQGGNLVDGVVGVVNPLLGIADAVGALSGWYPTTGQLAGKDWAVNQTWAKHGDELLSMGISKADVAKSDKDLTTQLALMQVSGSDNPLPGQHQRLRGEAWKEWRRTYAEQWYADPHNNGVICTLDDCKPHVSDRDAHTLASIDRGRWGWMEEDAMPAWAGGAAETRASKLVGRWTGTEDSHPWESWQSVVNRDGERVVVDRHGIPITTHRG